MVFCFQKSFASEARATTTLMPMRTGSAKLPMSTTKTTTMKSNNNNGQLSFMPQLFREKRMDVDCGSKICYLTHEVVDNCFLYIHKNNTDCEIPCKLDNCTRELHHFIACPIWHCHAIPTTTTTRTTTTTTVSTTTAKITTTTFDPNPFTLGPLPPLDHPGYLYSSFAFNILLVLVILGMLIQKCKKALIRRIRNRRNRNQQNEGDIERPPPPIVRLHQNSQRSRERQRQRRNFSMATSSSEDFDTSEHRPLIDHTQRAQRAQRSQSQSCQVPRDRDPSPRVPSFLNSPVLPPRHGSFSSTDNFQTRLRSTFNPEAPLQTFNPNPRVPRERLTPPLPPPRSPSQVTAETTV